MKKIKNIAKHVFRIVRVLRMYFFGTAIAVIVMLFIHFLSAVERKVVFNHFGGEGEMLYFHRIRDGLRDSIGYYPFFLFLIAVTIIVFVSEYRNYKSSK